MRKIPLIILLASFFAFYGKVLALQCDKECPRESCSDESIVTSDSTQNSDGVYICNGNPIVSGTQVDTPYKLGWASSCGVPAGIVTSDPDFKNNKTCVTNPNFWKTLIDAVTTLGIAIEMQNSFCSAEVGNTQIEGGILHYTFFDQCNGLAMKEKQECISKFLTGDFPNMDNSQDASAQREDFLNSKMTSTLCDGIPDMDKPILNNNGNFVFEGQKQVYCPMTRCNIPTDHIKSKYYDDKDKRTGIMAGIGAVVGNAWLPGLGSLLGAAFGAFVSAVVGSCCDVSSLRVGHEDAVAYGGIVKLRTVEEDGLICTQMKFTFEWTNISCKPILGSKAEKPKTKNCHLSTNSCTDDSKILSKAVLPITARMMQCVTEVMYSVFRSDGCSGQPNPIVNFQDKMKGLVKIALILYVMFFGLKMVIGGDMPEKSEIIMFALKIGLVIWLAVGGNLNPLASSENNANTNGLEFLFDASITAMGSFANMVAGDNATDQTKICRYTEKYESPPQINNAYTIDYSFLRVWDALDCRIGYYLGFLSPTSMGRTIADSSIGGGVFGGIFSFIWGLLFSFNFILLIFMLLLGIMILSVSVYVVHIYVIALIAISITIFMGPIFVPMVLFERTKSYFQNWLSLIIGYTLQPAIVVAFIMLMVTIFDGAMYKGCTFSSEPLTTGKPYWVLQTTDNTDCKMSLGYVLANNSPNSFMESTKILGLFPSFKVVHELIEVTGMIDALVLCGFFAFLFYYFGTMVSGFAAELSMSTNIGSQTVGANAVIDTVKEAVEAYINAKTGGAYGKAKQGISAAVEATDSGTSGGFKAEGNSDKRGGAEGPKSTAPGEQQKSELPKAIEGPKSPPVRAPAGEIARTSAPKPPTIPPVKR